MGGGRSLFLNSNFSKKTYSKALFAGVAGTVNFNTADGMDLGPTVNDGEGGSSDITNISYEIFSANAGGNASGASWTYYSDTNVGHDGILTYPSGDATIVIKSTNGSEFAFQGVTLMDYLGFQSQAKVEGFRNGISTGSVILNISRSTYYQAYTSTSFTSSIFQYIDEIRITNPNDYNDGITNYGKVNYLALDDIQFGEPVVAPVAGLGTALSFERSRSEGVQVPHHSSLDLGSGSFTIESWVKRASGTGFFNIVGKQNASATGVFLRFNDNKLSFAAGTYPASTEVASVSSISDNNWHHIAAVMDAGGKSMKIYIDGILDASSSFSTNYTVSSTANLGIGFRPGWADHFEGGLDEVRVWSTARTAAQIKEYMYTPLAGTEPGLVGYWNFEEGSGTSTDDRSTNSNTGTLQNSDGDEFVAGNTSYAVSVDEDANVSIRLGGSDLDNQSSATAVITALPSNGKLYQTSNGTTKGTEITAVSTSLTDSGGNPRRVIYEPTANYFGPDSFTFRVNDGVANSSNTQTVSLTINDMPDAPSTQASAITFTNTTINGTDIGWTNGNGSARAVFLKAASIGSAAPSDNTGYTASTSFGSGTQISTTGWYCVYNGTGTSVTVSGLSAGTTYRAMVVEYNGSSGLQKYLSTTATNNPNNFTTVNNPALTSATYNANTGVLMVTGTDFQAKTGALNDVAVSTLTLTGEGGATYTLTSSDVEITSATAFSVTLNATDKAAINQIINKNGTSSTGSTTYNLAATAGWMANVSGAADASGNGITASNVAVPAVTSATYNASTGALVVTGTGFLSASGASNDIVANKFTLTAEGGATYTLTDTQNGEITSGTSFTLTLSATDKASVNLMVNKNGTASTGGTTYNLAAAEDWAAGADVAVAVVDATGNGITVANVATPAVTSATYNANTGSLVVTGTGFLSASGGTNDIVANKFTFTGEGGATYTLTNTNNVEITSGTSFTLSLSATDKTAVDLLINKNGTSSVDATTYNLAAADDWTAGADAAVVTADLTGNSITASNVNTAPTDISLSASSINENASANSTIGTLSSTDANSGNTFTYTLVAGTGDTDNASFNISGNSLKVSNSPDYESKGSYSVRVRTTDQGGLTYEKAFTVTINNVNETPADVTLSASAVNENVTANATVGTLSTTDSDAGNTFTYTLVSGTGDTDNASFNISGSNLRITNSPDYESKSSYSIRVRTTDQGSLSYEKTFTITISDVNETPTDIALSASSVNENVAAGSTVGTLSSTDPDATNTFTYSFVTGTGDTDNASFTISGSTLKIAASANYESKSSYSIRVRTTDQNSLTYDEAFTISISDVNETPSDIALSASSVNENVAANATVGTLSTTDPDAGNTFTYTLVAGTGDDDNASFNISGGSLRITNSPNYEAKNSYKVRVRTTDQGSLTYEEAFTITINNLNEGPTDITLSASSINENVAANTTVGTLSSTDADASNTFTYTLVAGTGDTDNASFNINGSSLRVTNSPNYESKNSYTVRIRTTDQGSLTYEEAFTITINDVDDTAPTVTSVNVPSNAVYVASQNLDFTVNFNENITVDASGGTPYLSLTVGSSTRSATYQSGSGTSALSFRYTVQTGDTDANGIAVGTLALNGGTLKDAAANHAVLTLNSVSSTAGILVDAIAATVSSVSVPANGTYKTGANLDFTVNFSENLTVNTSAGSPYLGLTLNTGGTVNAGYVSGSGTSALIFRYTITSGNLDTDGVSLASSLTANGGTIKDAAGNDATLTLNSVGSTSGVLVDAVVPTLNAVSIVSNNATSALAKSGDQITVTFTASETVSSPSATIAGQTATVANTSGNTYTAKYTMTGSDTEGAIAFSISFSDAAGNSGTAVAATTDASAVTFDRTAPATPAGLAAVSGNAQNTISWTANAEGDLKSYKIYGGTSANPTTILNTANAVAASYTHTGLTNGTTYFYRISAIDNTGNESTVSADATTVPKAPQTITFNALAAKTYGDADFDPAASASSGLVLSYSSNNTAVATIVSGKVHIVGAGTATITASQAGSAAYLAAADETQTLTVNKKDIIVSLNASPVITKVYDNTASITLTAANYTLSGVESGDVSDVTVAGTASYADKNVGTGIAVTANAFVLGGTRKDNYNLTSTSASTTGTITKKDVTLSLNVTPVVTKAYDSNTSATLAAGNYSLSGIETGDAVTVAGTASYADKNVASSITVTAGNFVLAGAQKDNYNLTTTSATTTGTITKKDITVSLNASPFITKVYDAGSMATLASGNYSLSGVEAGDAVTVTGVASYADKNAASGIVITVNSFVLAGAQKDNYNLTTTSATTSGIITKKDITIALNASPAITKVYDGTTGAILVPGNYSLVGTEAGDEVKVTATANYDNQTAGTAKTVTANSFVLSGAQKDNYNLTTITASTTGDVTKKVLTVTADNKTRFQNTANPAFTLSYSGFISGEDKTHLQTPPTAITTAITNSPLGTYPITASGGVSNNYSFSYVPGTLTIVPGHPTSITLSAATLYENAPSGTLAGTLNSTSDDPSATFTYSLVSGNGSADNALFSISGNEIKSAASLDFEQKASYAVRLRSTTQHNLSLDKELIITLNNVNEQPTLNDISNQVICYAPAMQTVNLQGISAGQDAGQTTALSVSSTNNALFESLNVSPATGGNAELRYKISPGSFGAAVVNVMVMDNGGNANGGINTILKSFTIQVNPLPVIAISSDKGLVLSKGEVAILKADVSVANNGLSYSWSNANGVLSGQNTNNLTVRPSETTTYKVTVTNANNCSAEREITIAVNADYQVVNGTNIVSPNGDGVNDKLIIHNLDMYPKNEVKIFDRAGRLLYHQSNYTDQWDGTLNGSPLAEGTYYYVVDFGPGIEKKKGFISIIKD